MEENLITIEYYADPTCTRLVAAVDVPIKRRVESCEQMGKLLCRIWRLNSVEARLYDTAGDLMDEYPVYR